MAQDMMLFWGSGSAPCWRVMIALEEKQLQGYNHKLISFDKMEHKSQEIMELNPRGQVPTFKHGNNVVNESYAACFYLENQFQSQGTRLTPENPADLALVYQRVFEGVTLNEKINAVIYYEYFVPEAERQESVLKRNKDALASELQLWESYLQKLGPGSFIAGKSFSLADVTIFPNVANLFRYGLSAERFPRLAAYHSELKERASVKASWPPHWIENPTGQNTLSDV